MKRNPDMLSRRIAAISGAARPVLGDAPVSARKKRIRVERAKRRPVFTPGKLYTAENNYYPCIVCNISETGVLARSETHIPLPEIVGLKLTLSGFSRRARVAWQDDTDAGLQFIAIDENTALPAA